MLLLSLAAVDADDEPISYSQTGLPTGLTIDSGDGLISGTIGSTDDTTGTYSVSVTATDGSYSATQSFSWTISTPPTLTISGPGKQSNLEGDLVSLPVSAADPFGSPLTFSETGLPTGLTINPSDGVISGTVGSSAAGSSPYSATITATDGLGNTASTTFTWTVAALAFYAPGGQLNALSVPVSLDLSQDVAALPGTTLTYSNTGLPTGLSLNSSTGLVTGTPYTAGNYLVKITVSDGTHSATGSFTWQISSVSIAAPQDQTNTEGDPVSVQLAGIAAGQVTYVAANLPAGLTLDGQTGVISGTLSPGDAANSPYFVDIAAISGGNAASQSFLWTVNPKISVTAIGDQISTEGTAVGLQVSASETGVTAFTFSADNLPAGLSINSSTGLITGTILTGDALNGPDYFVTVKVTDGTYSASVYFWWTVEFATAPGNPSVQSIGNQSSVVGQTVSLSVNATDSPGFYLDYDAFGLPDGLYIDPFTGVIQGTVSDVAASPTPYDVTVLVDDGFGDYTTQSFQWTVQPRTLTAQLYPITATEGTSTGTITLGTFTTPDLSAEPGEFLITINWGDERTSEGWAEGGNGTFTIKADHNFDAAGTLTVSVDIWNIWGALPEVDVSTTATVTDATLTMTGGFQLGALMDQSASLTLAYFTVANPHAQPSDFTASIAWGDGSTSTATVSSAGAGLFAVTANHSYAEDGLEDATITVTDAAGSSQSTTSTVEVGNLYAGVNGTLSLASFVDATSGVTASSFTVSINWGDGNTTSGTVTQSGTLFTVSGTHAFAVDSIDNTGGVYDVVVTITGGSNILRSTVPVEVTRPASSMWVAKLAAGSGTILTNQLTALFVEPDTTNGTAEFDASISWGDNSSSVGTVQEIGNGLFQVVGNHTFASKPDAVSVTVGQAWQLPIADSMGQVIPQQFVPRDGVQYIKLPSGAMYPLPPTPIIEVKIVNWLPPKPPRNELSPRSPFAPQPMSNLAEVNSQKIQSQITAQDQAAANAKVQQINDRIRAINARRSQIANSLGGGKNDPYVKELDSKLEDLLSQSQGLDVVEFIYLIVPFLESGSTLAKGIWNGNKNQILDGSEGVATELLMMRLGRIVFGGPAQVASTTGAGSQGDSRRREHSRSFELAWGTSEAVGWGDFRTDNRQGIGERRLLRGRNSGLGRFVADSSQSLQPNWNHYAHRGSTPRRTRANTESGSRAGGPGSMLSGLF